MPVIDKSPLLEAAESLNAYREDYNKRQQRKLNEAAQAKAAIDRQRYFGTKYKREQHNIDMSVYAESLKNELLGDALKGIYIGALMENKALTEDGLALADHLMDNYIKEAGGATALLGKMKGKTYALDYIRCCVEGTYEAILEADDDDKKEDKDDDKEDSKGEDNQIEDDDEEESSDDGEDNQIENDDEEDDDDGEFESITKGDDEDKDDDEDTSDADGSDDGEPETGDKDDSADEEEPAEEPSDDEEAEPAEDNVDDADAEAPEEPEGDEEVDDTEVDDADDVPSTEESPEERQQMMDDLSQDEDIENAVNIIAQRCADAEEEFIKKNNEDKKAIEDIASRVADRISGSEGDAATSDEEAEEVKEEATRIGKQEVNKYNERRVTNVYENVVYNLTTSIVKDTALRESYTEESGRLDMHSVMESAYCIYGLLETVNTLQLERVDAAYIQKALSTM